MLNQENKLKKFEKSIWVKVNKNIDKMEKETEDIKRNEMYKIELEQKSKSKDIIQKSTIKIKEECKKDISLAEINARKDILKIRAEITNKVFERAKEMILEFCKTDEYKKMLKKDINKFIDFSNIDRYIVYLSNRDIGHKDFISCEIGSDLKIIQDSSILIGGFKIAKTESNILIDETLETKLEDQRENFNELYKYHLNIYTNNEVD